MESTDQREKRAQVDTEMVQEKIVKKKILYLFSDTGGGHRSAAIAIMRAVENRKYFIQAANTGISAVIDPYGRILKQSKINETAVLSFELMRP